LGTLSYDVFSETSQKEEIVITFKEDIGSIVAAIIDVKVLPSGQWNPTFGHWTIP
jgi:hypothetical protein